MAHCAKMIGSETLANEVLERAWIGFHKILKFGLTYVEFLIT